MDIMSALFPLIFVSCIVVFVILRMNHKYKKGTLGKKESKGAQQLLDSSIPLGMLIGCMVAIVLSFFIPLTLLDSISYGIGIGFLLGYVAYEIYSKKEESINN
nr:hypothetical protein [Alteribacter aurantiacus]